MNPSRLLATLLVAALGIGCSTTTSVTLLSTKNVDLSARHDVVARGEKSSNGRMWLLILPLGPEPSALKAARDLLERKQGDYLTNVQVESSGFSLLAISFGSVSVKADVWQRATTPPPQAAPAVMPAPVEKPSEQAAPMETPSDEPASEATSAP